MPDEQTPRTVADIQKEYFALNAQIGEWECQRKKLAEQIEEGYAKFKALHAEANAVQAAAQATEPTP